MSLARVAGAATRFIVFGGVAWAMGASARSDWREGRRTGDRVVAGVPSSSGSDRWERHHPHRVAAAEGFSSPPAARATKRWGSALLGHLWSKMPCCSGMSPWPAAIGS